MRRFSIPHCRLDTLRAAISALANHPACSTNNSTTSEPRPCLDQVTPKRRDKSEVAKSRVSKSMACLERGCAVHQSAAFAIHLSMSGRRLRLCGVLQPSVNELSSSADSCAVCSHVSPAGRRMILCRSWQFWWRIVRDIRQVGIAGLTYVHGNSTLGSREPGLSLSIQNAFPSPYTLNPTLSLAPPFTHP